MPGLQLLFQLTEALCELSCLEDPQGRVQFAVVLGQQLTQQVDVRGGKLREDAVTMVRAALSVMGGEHVLVGVVRVFEGEEAAAGFERLLLPVAPPVASVVLPGPLSEYDKNKARALLDTVKGEISAIRLRDELVEELHGVELPVGLSPEQLLTHVAELNVQPDGLPPAVLLLDRAARLAGVPGHRAELSAWVDGWAERAQLTQELRDRRARPAEVEYDSEIPRCLTVAAEPARDGSDEIVVRVWLNTVPGRWDPQPGESATTDLDGLGAAVEAALRQGARLWPEQREPDASGRPPLPPYIEFVLPYDLLNHDVAGLLLTSGDGRPLPLGLKYGIHLRSLERMRTDDVLVKLQWRERWRTLRQHGVAVYGWSEPDARRLDEWQTSLAGESRHTAVVLDAPAGASALEALKAAIAEGIGLAIWDRRGVFVEERREVVTAVFASVPTPAQIPVAIHRLRRKAELNSQGPLLLGRHIAFFWDDPTRLVDIQTIDPDELASEEAPA
ncbi:effector-associated domain 2-containing protein [Streptomyces sp. FR-108]|uniref:VMAP-C domain-containing protein n=1 Tax=Streptomyces sp. FR-108 TaxID=3416665 RepID=UPI003CFBA7EE